MSDTTPTRPAADPFPTTAEEARRAAAIHKRTLIVDALTTSVLDREYLAVLRAAGVDATNYTVADTSLVHGQVLQDDFETACRKIAMWLRRLAEMKDVAGLATTVAEMDALKAQGRFAVFFGFQNASPIEDNVDLLDVFHRLGVRFIQLTYNARNMVGSGSGERNDDGLSDLGVAAVQRMNELGIVVDLSHCAYRTTMDAIEASSKPVAFTHANMRALADTPRNKTDDQLRALVRKGGIVGVKHMIGDMVSKKAAETTVEDVADNIEHAIRVVGLEHVCIGTDFSGTTSAMGLSDAEINAIRARWPNAYLGSRSKPRWFRTIADLPNLTTVLLRRGYSEEDIAAIYGGNLRRFMLEVIGA